MKYLLCLLVLSAAGNANADKIMIRYSYDSACKYSCYTVLWSLNAWKSGLKWDLFGQDTARAIAEYRKSLNQNFGPSITDNILFGTKWRQQQINHLQERNMALVKDPSEIDVSRIYSFSSNPDFVIFFPTLLRHIHDPITNKIIYLPGIDSVFFYEELNFKIDPDEFRNTFNYWVDNSEDLQSMDALCLAGLLLYLRYRCERVYFIEKFQNLFIAKTIEWVVFPGSAADLSDYPSGYYYSLYYPDVEEVARDNPALDSLVVEEMKINKHRLYDKYRDYQFHSPVLNSDSISTQITLTIMSGNELADWVIELNSSNHLISMEYATEPVLPASSDTLSSPYYRDRP